MPREMPGTRGGAPLTVLAERWPIALGLVAAFAAGAGVGWVRLRADRERQLERAERFADRAAAKGIYERLRRPHGLLRAIAWIFLVNTVSASLGGLLGGVTLVVPFVWLGGIGRMLVLTLARRPEKRRLTALVAPPELTALVLAGTGGVHVGIAVLHGNAVAVAARPALILFASATVPLLVLAAVVEGVGLHRKHVVRGEAPPLRGPGASRRH